jgi:hypothetical protein
MQPKFAGASHKLRQHVSSFTALKILQAGSQSLKPVLQRGADFRIHSGNRSGKDLGSTAERFLWYRVGDRNPPRRRHQLLFKEIGGPLRLLH